MRTEDRSTDSQIDPPTPEEESLFQLRAEAQRACLSFIISSGRAQDNGNFDTLDNYSSSFKAIFDEGKCCPPPGNRSARSASEIYMRLSGIQLAFYDNAARKVVSYMLAAGLIHNSNEFLEKGYATALRIFLCGNPKDLESLQFPEPVTGAQKTATAIHEGVLGEISQI